MNFGLFTAAAVWGVLFAIPFAILRAVRHHQFDAGKTVIVFLAGTALPSYVRLLRAAVFEKVDALPPDWPTYAGLSAVVALGLAIAEILKSFKVAWAKQSPDAAAQATVAPASPQASVASTEPPNPSAPTHSPIR